MQENIPEQPIYIVSSEVDSGRLFAGHIFERKFKQEAPEIPRHFVTFYRKPNGMLIPTTYLHAWKYKNCYLVGGGCTDGNAYAEMEKAHSNELSKTPGLFYYSLIYLFNKLKMDCSCFFGYAGDPRAVTVDILAGFRKTKYENLLIYKQRRLARLQEHYLTKSVAALGPF